MSEQAAVKSDRVSDAVSLIFRGSGPRSRTKWKAPGKRVKVKGLRRPRTAPEKFHPVRILIEDYIPSYSEEARTVQKRFRDRVEEVIEKRNITKKELAILLGLYNRDSLWKIMVGAPTPMVRSRTITLLILLEVLERTDLLPKYEKREKTLKQFRRLPYVEFTNL